MCTHIADSFFILLFLWQKPRGGRYRKPCICLEFTPVYTTYKALIIYFFTTC